MKLEDDYKTDCGTGAGTTTGYSVEARVTGRPTVANGHLLTDKWTRVEFSPSESPCGVPVPGCYDGSGQMVRRGLYSYESAQALRWWFHAAAEEETFRPFTGRGAGFLARISGNAWAIETRLVRHEIKYNYSVTAVSAHDCVEKLARLSPEKVVEPFVPTAEELAAVKLMVEMHADVEDSDPHADPKLAGTLRGLLQRLGGGNE